MNERTVKLLKRYAGETSQEYDQLKRAWMAMDHRERTRARKEMQRSLAPEAAAAGETAKA